VELKRESSTVEQLLAEARARLDRLDPAAARPAMDDGALLVDIRSDAQRERDGVVPGSTFIPRNVLEWRVEQMQAAPRVILMCDEGYQSSLAAATLCELGLDAADLAGGFQAWREAGLPVAPEDFSAGIASVPDEHPRPEG
jgi:rhodanese-related sulfurtransferase